MKNIKILFCILFLSIINFEVFCQRIEKIDSSEVYILSLFRFENDKIHTSNRDKLYTENKSQNILQVYVLDSRESFQFHLITGDNKYNYISLNDSIKINYIDSIIGNYAFANMYFLRDMSKDPISIIDNNLHLDNDDSTIINKYLYFRNIFKNPNYQDDASFYENLHQDMIDGRLINEFYNTIIGFDYFFNKSSFGKLDDCIFKEKGLYYMLLKVNLTYIVIDDQDQEYLYCNKMLTLGEHPCKDEFLICDKYMMKIKYFIKDDKKPLAIPLNLILVKPFTDKYRYYYDYKKKY